MRRSRVNNFLQIKDLMLILRTRISVHARIIDFDQTSTLHALHQVYTRLSLHAYGFFLHFFCIFVKYLLKIQGETGKSLKPLNIKVSLLMNKTASFHPALFFCFPRFHSFGQTLIWVHRVQGTVIGITQPPPRDGACCALLHEWPSQNQTDYYISRCERPLLEEVA